MRSSAELREHARLEAYERELESAIKYMCEQNLETFVRMAWPVVEPMTEFKMNWHITLICEYLMMVTAGKIKRLIINIPPRYSKSTLVSVMWPCWEWIHTPNQRFICVSYAATLSEFQSMRRRQLLTSDWYQANWGRGIRLRDDRNRVADFMNTVGGAMFSTSLNGTLTGMGGNRIVIDDPTNPIETMSRAMRESANDWFFNTLLSRLDNKRKGAIVLIQQRLHTNDMTGSLTGLGPSELDGYLLEGNGWTLLRLPLIAERDETIVSPIDGRVIKELREGELMWPERESPEMLADYKKDPYVFASQYQQRPAPVSGAIFQREWLQFFDSIPDVNEKPTWIMSVDASFYGGRFSDYVAIGVWAWLRPNMYLYDVIRRRMGFTETVAELRRLFRQYPATSAVLIESAANGPAIIDELQKEVSGVIPIKPVGSKEARAFAVTPYFQAKNVLIRRAHWTSEYIDELLNFPSSAYDDQVDMTTQAISYMQQTFNRAKAAHRLIITRPNI